MSRVPQGEQLNPEGGVRGSVTNFDITILQCGNRPILLDCC